MSISQWVLVPQSIHTLYKENYIKKATTHATEQQNID